MSCIMVMRIRRTGGVLHRPWGGIGVLVGHSADPLRLMISKSPEV